MNLGSTLGALLHLLKSSLGTGILAMPNAFGNAGLLFGSVMTIIVGVLCTHCVWILVSRTPLERKETSFQVFNKLFVSLSSAIKRNKIKVYALLQNILQQTPAKVHFQHVNNFASGAKENNKLFAMNWICQAVC